MGWRFRRSIRIAPGVRVNLSSRGVSTTLGGRGVSVNTGGRGTYLNAGIPGTGISSRSRIGNASGAADKASAAGCAGVCCLGFAFLVILGTCLGDSDPNQSAYQPAPAVAEIPRAPSEPFEERSWFYLHAEMNVRANPGTEAARLRTLARGTRVQLGPSDANGWARVYTSGAPDGYLYRASGHVRTTPPAARSASSGSGAATGGSARRRTSEATGYYVGPRGGCYTYSSSGRKRYVDRSYCY